MFAKFFIVIVALIGCCTAGIIPAVPAAIPAAYTIGTYASSYNAHAVNHAIAAPYVAAPAIAAPAFAAPGVAASYVASAPAFAAAPYTYPAFGAYSAPIIAGRR